MGIRRKDEGGRGWGIGKKIPYYSRISVSSTVRIRINEVWVYRKLTPRKRSILLGWRSTSVKLWSTLELARIFLLNSFIRVGKAPRPTFPFQIIRLTSLSVGSANKSCFFVNFALISFILKFYPLFCVNSLYLKVVLYLIRVNFQYLKFIEC